MATFDLIAWVAKRDRLLCMTWFLRDVGASIKSVNDMASEIRFQIELDLADPSTMELSKAFKPTWPVTYGSVILARMREQSTEKRYYGPGCSFVIERAKNDCG